MTSATPIPSNPFQRLRYLLGMFLLLGVCLLFILMGLRLQQMHQALVLFVYGLTVSSYLIAKAKAVYRQQLREHHAEKE